MNDVLQAPPAQGAALGTKLALQKMVELRDATIATAFWAYLEGADDVDLEDYDETIDGRMREQRARAYAEGMTRIFDDAIRALCENVEICNTVRDYVCTPRASLAAALNNAPPPPTMTAAYETSKKGCTWPL